MQISPTFRTAFLLRFLVTVSLPLVVIGGFSLHFVTQKTTESLEVKNQLLVGSLAGEVEESLREPKTVLRQLAGTLRDYFSPEDDTANYLLDSAVRNSSYFSSIYLLDRQGFIRRVGLPVEGEANRGDYLDLDLSRMDFFRSAQGQSGFFWSDTFLSPLASHQAVSLVLPFAGNFLVGNLNLQFLSRLLDHDRGERHLDLWVVDRSGNLIFQSQNSHLGQRINLNNLAPVRMGLGGKEGTFRYQWEGRERLGSVARVPETGWLVLISQEANEAFAVTRQVRNTFLIGILAALALSVLAALTFARNLARPLETLADGAAAIATGDYSVALPGMKLRELENLAESLRHMAGEIRHREEELSKSREHYLRLFNGGSDLVFVHGFEEDGTPGKFTEVNDVACARLGYRREELLDMRPRDLDHLPETRPAEFVKILGNLKNHGEALFQSDFMTRAGLQIPFELNAQLFQLDGEPRVMTIARDISERRAAEQALRRSEQEHRLLSGQFQTLFDAIPDALMLFGADLQIIWANQGAAELLGVSREAMQKGGLASLELQKVPCPDGTVAACFESGDVEAGRVNLEDQRILETRAFPIKDEAGQVLRVIELVSDATEKVRAQQETIRTGQLAALGELAAGVAHEINNPINGIINYAQILVNQAARAGEAADIPDRIIREGNRIASIVNSLLSFARKKKEDVKPVPLHEVLSDALTLMKTQMRKDGIRIDVDLAMDLPPVAGRYQQLEQVIINLLSNARHALNQKFPERNEEKTLEISGRLTKEGFIRLEVHDRGVGIPEQIRDRILSPFFSTRNAGEGTGLGLSITQSIISDHGGKLVFESVEGVFTKVIIDLPVYHH